MTAPIEVGRLSKVFRVHEREAGLVATMRSLVKRCRVTLRDPARAAQLSAYGEVVEHDENRVSLRVSREAAPDRTASLVRDLQGQVMDLTLEDPAMPKSVTSSDR